MEGPKGSKSRLLREVNLAPKLASLPPNVLPLLLSLGDSVPSCRRSVGEGEDGLTWASDGRKSTANIIICFPAGKG